jgi:hypothetical protein
VSFRFLKEGLNTQESTVIHPITTYSTSARSGRSTYHRTRVQPNRFIVAKTADTIVHFREVGIQRISRNHTANLAFPKGHPQKEHETSHGSMSRVKWSVEGPEDTALEVNGHKFGTDDDGAPMMCNLYCTDLGRHVHVDYCRSENPASCNGAEIQHISTKVRPSPEKPKDWITHGLHWKRMGLPHSFSLLPFSLTSQQDSKACQRSRDFYGTDRICRSVFQG